jgi:predicted DNA binding protein
MSVIIELSLPAAEFELGRILELTDDASIVLETMVPLGERSVPFFRHYDGSRESFERSIQGHPAVDELQVVSTHDGETLYALDWQIADDTFFKGIRSTDAHLLEATGTARAWAFELRFPSHDALAQFRQRCVDADLPLDIKRIYNPTKPDAGPWYGLTPRQREMLARAVDAGYYSIPRQTSTKALADEFGISDQAVTERLRRAIATLVTNTLLIAEQEA